MDETFVDRDLAGVIAPPPNPFFKSGGVEDKNAADGEALDRASLDEGPVVLSWPDTLSKESVEEFEYWVNGLIKRAKRKAGMTKKPSLRPGQAPD